MANELDYNRDLSTEAHHHINANESFFRGTKGPQGKTSIEKCLLGFKIKILPGW